MKSKTARQIAEMLSVTLDNLVEGNANLPLEDVKIRAASALIKTYRERREYARDCKRTPNIPELE